jgi:hypothetical protein
MYNADNSSRFIPVVVDMIFVGTGMPSDIVWSNTINKASNLIHGGKNEFNENKEQQRQTKSS